MKRFAVNVVILPPDPVMDLALEWNRELCTTHPTNIVLDKMHYLPHVSLAMGCLEANQLEQAQFILQSIASQHRALELRVPQVKILNTNSGNRVVTFDIELSPALTRLHEAIVVALRPLLTQDAVEADLNDVPPIDTAALEWINHYIPHHCFQHFWPHITLGFGQPPNNFQAYTFQASRLAICHLGNHCTCRQILEEALLESFE